MINCQVVNDPLRVQTLRAGQPAGQPSFGRVVDSLPCCQLVGKSQNCSHYYSGEDNYEKWSISLKIDTIVINYKSFRISDKYFISIENRKFERYSTILHTFIYSMQECILLENKQSGDAQKFLLKNI
jgi:hypothetical protein